MEVNMRKTYLMSDLSKRLNVPPYRIAYLLTTRQLPEPKRVGNRRVFNETDARQVAKALDISWEAINEPQEAHE
jgi:DNA-binding transcriptional MerR regulator